MSSSRSLPAVLTAAMALYAHVAVASALPAAAASAATTEEGGRIRTQVVSLHDVTISSEVEGKIASLPLNDGDAFKRGQQLVAFDCDLYSAQLRKVEATADAAAKVY